MESPLTPSATSKLPVKRKTPDSLTFKLEPVQLIPAKGQQPIRTVDSALSTVTPPPFKFHRIWTDPDEIRFLQGLLDSASRGLCFPRDLPIFYENFSNSTSQPYSKCQLSEKLRRLRKKYRVTSSRVSGGLDESQLTSHDRSLYELSKKLWSPAYANASPFGKNIRNSSNNLLGVEVNFSPNIPFLKNENGSVVHTFVDDDNINMCGVHVDMSYDFAMQKEEKKKKSGCEIKGVVAKSALDAFDECLKEVRMVFEKQRAKEERQKEFERRWEEQRSAELEVYTRRLRLALENSLNRL